MRGKVKKWVISQGYGFIESENLVEDIIVQHQDLKDIFNLNEGQIVDFDIDKKGPRQKAVNVKIIK